MVGCADLIGNIETNPYYFKDHDLEQIAVHIDSDTGSSRQEINIDISKNQYMEAYRNLNNTRIAQDAAAS